MPNPRLIFKHETRSVTVTDRTAARGSIPLPGMTASGLQERVPVLRKVRVVVESGLVTEAASPTATGPVGVYLWLNDIQAGGTRSQVLDIGYAMNVAATGPPAVVGMEGYLPYGIAPTDETGPTTGAFALIFDLFFNGANDGTTTVDVRCDALIEMVPVENLQPGQYQRLSTLHHGIFEFSGDITNGAGGAGDQTYTVTFGTAQTAELLYGSILNGDTAARTVSATIDDGAVTDTFTRLIAAISTAAATRTSFPNSGPTSANDNPATSGARFILGGTQRFVATIAAVAASQDTRCELVFLIPPSPMPTVTLAGASTPTLSTDTLRVVTAVP